MNKQRPSNGAMLSMAAFTASCIGLLLFLWISFGGSLPLAPQGYRFSVEFDQAVELATQAQVEISGVPIGQVVSVALDHRTGLSRAVIQIDRQFAPRPADTRAILRQKTLLGETYVELPDGAEATRRRDASQGAGGADGAAGPDLRKLRSDDPARVSDLDAAGGDRPHQSRRAVQCRAGRPVSVCRSEEHTS